MNVYSISKGSGDIEEVGVTAELIDSFTYISTAPLKLGVLKDVGSLVASLIAISHLLPNHPHIG